MKKIFLTVIVVLLAVTTVSAQYKGDWGVGPKIGVYTNAGADGAIFGIGAAGQYSITDNWRVAPSILALCKPGLLGGYQRRRTIPVQHRPRLAYLSAGRYQRQRHRRLVVRYQPQQRKELLDHPQLGRFGRFKWMIQTAKDYVPGFVKRRNPIVINIGATYRF